MEEWGRKLKHYLWYNAQDSDYYDTDDAYFDGLAINAHIIAHNAKAFLALQLTHPKPYFILPDLHYFQFYSNDYFDNHKGGIKTSWEKLLTSYPAILATTLAQHRPLVPGDLSVSNSLEVFCRGVLQFQQTALNQPFQALSRLISAGAQCPRPEFLVSPYFYFDTVGDQSYDLALSANRTSAGLKGTDRLFVCVCCSKDNLNANNINRIVTDFNQSSIDGFLVWLDDFDETAASEQDLRGLKILISELAATGRPVINLFGGHFSALLNLQGLTAYGSGICTKDSLPARPIIQTGGPAGGPIPLYYIPRLHTKLVQEEARRLIGQIPQLVCDCDICQNNRVLDMPNQSSSERSLLRRLMRRHFLHVRSRQLAQMNSLTPPSIIAEISGSAALVSGIPAIFDGRFLGRWVRVLTSLP